MKQIITYIILFFCWLNSSFATNADTTLHAQQPITTIEKFVSRQNIRPLPFSEAIENPSVMNTAFNSSFIQLQLLFAEKKQSESFQLEYGDEQKLFTIDVDSYKHISERLTLWGKATYYNATKHNTKWNNVADFDLLFPYIIADSLGGNNKNESYNIGGGFALQLKQWNIGGTITYRGEQEYRTADPRTRCIVSDLNMKIGVSRAIRNYKIAFAAKGNIYNQTADVDFYSDIKSATEYQLTGLGTSYTRFSSSQRNIYFDGLGGELSADIVPIQKGWNAHLLISQHKYDRISDEYNSVKLTTLYVQKYRLTIGNKNFIRNTSAWIDANMTKRIGDEHIVGSASQQDYPIVASLTMYTQKCLDTHLGLMNTINSWNITTKIGLNTSDEKYIYPERLLKTSHAYISALGQKIWHTQKCLFNLKLNADYRHCINEKIKMPYANITNTIRQYINHNYTFQKANYLSLGTSMRTEMPLSTFKSNVFGQISGNWTRCSESENEFNIQLSFGIIIN